MITVCVPIKDKSKLDIEAMNLKVLGDYRLLVSDAIGLANSRNELISQVETDWFLFIDDDVRINEDWWNKIKPYMNNERLGAVNGLGYSNSIILKVIRKTLLLFRGDKVQRGFTSNTLIRTALVKDIKLNRIGRLEDMELQEKIKAKGYDWLLCPEAECQHLKPAKTVWKEAVNDFKVLIREKGLFGAIRRI